MTICTGEKFVLTDSIGGSTHIGDVYEVTRIYPDKIILRDVSHVNVVSLDANDFNLYFKKFKNTNSWSKWSKMVDSMGNTVAYYRSKNRRVQVQTVEGYKAEASCCNADDFDLFVGVRIAYDRCLVKAMKSEEKKLTDAINTIQKQTKSIRAKVSETKHQMKMLINSFTNGMEE